MRASVPSARDAAAAKASASSGVFSSEKLSLIVQSASVAESPKSVSAALTFACVLLDAHADPLDTKIPSRERKWSIVSLLMRGRVMLKICGAVTAASFTRSSASAPSCAMRALTA